MRPAVLVLDHAGSEAALEFAGQLTALGFRVKPCATSRDGARRVGLAPADTPLIYVHTRTAEWSEDAGARPLDCIAALREWAEAFPELVDNLGRHPSARLIIVGSSAVWGHPDPRLASHSGWLLSLVRNIGEIAGGAILANFVIGQRGAGPWQTGLCADLIHWLSSRNVSGQEFDLGASETAGVLRW